MAKTKENMIKTQVFLRTDQKIRLKRISRVQNKKSAAIIRKALDKMLDEYEQIEKKNWLDGFENFKGCFSDERVKEFKQEIKLNRKQLSKRKKF